MELLQRIWKALASPAVLISALGMGCLFLAGIFIVLGLASPAEPAPAAPAALTVIPGPTATRYVPTPPPTRVPTATSNLPSAPLPGIIGIGSSVQISGTDGSGLNIRGQAGLGSSVRFVALDSEVFKIGDGPVEADGITWWFLVTPLDEERNGWAAANYLSLVVPED
ncbi:MAG: hypothetical protein JW757_12410 [Anaerolineales bacterium]|nr:hypothetical protein [Anaerolineales bacterium]